MFNAKEYAKNYYEKNKDIIKKRASEYNKNNSEKHKIARKKWRDKNKQACKTYEKQYREKFPEKGRARLAKRRATKLKQTPKWADLKAIEAFYKNCPKGYHVDHIIPLQGKNVRGLHVLENLQYLSSNDNIRKGNKYE